MLTNKKIVIGVTGGIAAYKAVEIGSRLKKKGAEVHFILTKNAQKFVGAVTFQAISNNPVVTDMFDSPQTWDTEHISLAHLADVFLIAPATANIIGKLAGGIADDMLSTTAMATKAPLIIAPAMNTNMYLNPSVQDNLEILKSRGIVEIPPVSGRLACNDIGVGKLPDPFDIVKWVEHYALRSDEFKGKRIVVTAGATIESIDPVRYITNRSTGKMGYAIARQAFRMGAEVILISGNTSLDIPFGVKFISAKSSEQMYNAVFEYKDCDVFISAAAVADYRPKNISKNKIKKSESDIDIKLVRTNDILAEFGKNKTNHQLVVGFAAETENVIEYARKKLVSKNADIFVANDVSRDDAGFETDTNEVMIFEKDGSIHELELMSKDETARRILDVVYNKLSHM